jgi:mRNA-degrading endonuclease toxin of MazEF toxin-antitoxin module
VIEQGEISIADLNLEARLPVLVLSNRRFHQLTGRALVAPSEQMEPFPWRIEHGDASYAVDLARTVSVDNLGDVVGTVSVSARNQAIRALRFITA